MTLAVTPVVGPSVDFRPLRGRRRVDQLVILAIPIGVIAAAGWAGLSWYRQRLTTSTEKELAAKKAIEFPVRIAYDLLPADLDGMYQGPLARTDDHSAWLVLTITQTHRVDEDRVLFQYDLNAVKRRQRGVGEASLDGKWIRFAGMHGQIVRNAHGAIMLRSMPRGTLPQWTVKSSLPAPERARRVFE